MQASFSFLFCKESHSCKKRCTIHAFIEVSKPVHVNAPAVGAAFKSNSLRARYTKSARSVNNFLRPHAAELAPIARTHRTESHICFFKTNYNTKERKTVMPQFSCCSNKWPEYLEFAYNVLMDNNSTDCFGGNVYAKWDGSTWKGSEGPVSIIISPSVVNNQLKMTVDAQLSSGDCEGNGNWGDGEVFDCDPDNFGATLGTVNINHHCCDGAEVGADVTWENGFFPTMPPKDGKPPTIPDSCESGTNGTCSGGFCTGPQLSGPVTQSSDLFSSHPVKYATGEMLITANDLPVAGSSAFWGHTRKFRNRLDSNNLLENGFNWQVEQLPYFVKSYEGDVAVFGKSLSAYWFEEDSNGDFDPKFATTKQTFEYNSSTQRHILTDTDGSTIEFLGNGNFDKYTSKSGEVVEVKSRSGNYPAVVERVATSGSDTVTEQMVYTYDSSMYDPLLTSIVMKQKVNSGAWTNQHKVSFTYYGYSDSNGVEKSLKSATTANWDGSTWAETGTSLYRYYTSGTSRTLLKYVVNPASYARLDADTSVSDPFTASDTKVAEYADHYFEYDSEKRVTREEVEGGSRTFTFSYTESAFSDDPNHWKTKTVETLPDSSQNIVYSNYLGKTMLHVFKSGSEEWHHFKEYDSDGRVVLEATPAAITGYDDTKADLLDYNSGTSKYAYLKDSDGLIRTYTYHTASGYRSSESIKQGQTGTEIKLNETNFTACPETGFSHVYVVSKGTLYPDDTVQTTKNETTYSYTWHSGTAQVKEKTTTFPVVSTSQNGSGTAATRKDYFDEQGHLIWQQDERGYITRNFYDLATGMPTQQIADADTSLLTNVPSGWSTPVDGGQHLITDFVYDNQGRHLETFGPWHTADVDGTPTLVRRAQWSLYFDNATGREVRTARGYAVEGSGGGYAYTTNNYDYHLINPVSITKTDLKGNVLEQIEAKTSVLTGTADEMFGSEITFTQADYTRWHTYQYTDCCRVLSERVYHEIPTSGEGLKTTNYAETGYRYNSDKKRIATISPGGTITRNVLDDRNNVIETWIGTNDTGATDSDPSGAGATGNNMVIITSVQYDGGSDGGNNLVTQQTQHVDASTTRVTSFVYDWRNRRVDTNGELDFFQRDYYDNLNRMIKTERYDTSSSGNLVSRQETKYDDRGRTYRTIQHGIDPSTGNPAGGTQTDNRYYDESGNVTKVTPSNVELYREFTYDGLRRRVTEKDPLNATTTYAYDDANNRTSLTDAQSNQTTWKFDPIGRIVKETNELNYTRSFSYSNAGTLSSKTDRESRNTEYSYDDMGRMTSEVWKEGATTLNTITKTYDINSRLLTALDNASSYTYTYDGLGNLATASNSGTAGSPAVILTPDYNRLNERMELATSVGGTNDLLNSYSFDALGRTSRIQQEGVSGGNSVADKGVDFSYGVIGTMSDVDRYESLTTSNNLANTELVYDSFGRLSSQTHKKSTTTLSSAAVTYDANRRIDSLTVPSGIGDFTYDDAGQLTEADYDFQTDETFSYDSTGNRTMTGYSTGDNNQLTSDGTYNYTYDNEGNRTRKTTISTSDYVEYEWDHHNRLTKVTYRNSSDVKTKEFLYTYDVYDRRIRKQVDANGNGTIESSESFVYDAGVKGDLTDILFVIDGSSNITHRYLHGPMIDQPLAEEHSSGTYWLLAGHLGTITDVIEYASGTDTTTVVNSLEYNSFGGITSETDSTKTPHYTFTGREWDNDVDLYYYRARWYDAQTGRFTSEDPIGFEAEDSNLSRYVNNSPANFTDPSGNILIECHYHSSRNSRTKVLKVNCTGLIDNCCPQQIGRGGSTMGRTGVTLPNSGPDSNTDNCCSRSGCIDDCTIAHGKCLSYCLLFCWAAGAPVLGGFPNPAYFACLSTCNNSCDIGNALCEYVICSKCIYP